jgi:hypothetical protein
MPRTPARLPKKRPRHPKLHRRLNRTRPHRPSQAEPWKSFTPQLSQSDLVARFVEASRLLLGVPYVNGPLGEGDVGGPDPEPRYDLTRADCVTFLEESLALALTAPRSDPSYVPILDAIRYHDGKVGFASRNHYMVLDWIPSNSWLLEDVTDDVVSDGHTRKIEKEIDRAAFLRDHGVEPRPGIDKLEKVEIEMIPIDDVRAAEAGLRSGDLVMWVAKKEGIDIAHTGMVVRAKDGSLIHRMARPRPASLWMSRSSITPRACCGIRRDHGVAIEAQGGAARLGRERVTH